MKNLIFATNNPHKLYEIRQIIGKEFEILSLADIDCNEEIPEDENTLEGNASFKAWFVYNNYGTDCFADDTGLEIDALDGQPGVKSARYAGDDCNPQNNIRKILQELGNCTDRKARFRTVISLIMNGKESRFDGIVEGVILPEKRGKEGFGYDPVFMPEGKSLTFAEMDLDEKNTISHRARAFEKLRSFLSRHYIPDNKEVI